MLVKTDASLMQGKLLRAVCVIMVLFSVLGTQAAEAQQPQQRLVVRDTLGLSHLLGVCRLLGCSVIRGVGDPDGEVFVVSTPLLSVLNVLDLWKLISINLGIISVELDQVVKTQATSPESYPSYLTDRTPVDFYGTTVWRGYVTQPAAQIIQAEPARSIYGVTGSGVTVAVIDTGVDPNQPVLKSSLLAGYDFTRNQPGGSEMADVSQSTVAVLDGGNVARLSQSTVAVLDQSTVAVLDGDHYAAFGHGTMVSGIIHLVAPNAKILPLKSFASDGSAYSSDILRAIYYAANNHADVINMSWNYTTNSPELARAINYASSKGVICVAAAGNSGEQTNVYPGAYKNVIDVASTSNQDTQSSFSNYGAPPVWVAAPGEGVMTTYPFGTYAAGWGTSFSAPLTTGATALMVSMYKAQAPKPTALQLLLGLVPKSPVNESQAATALSHAEWISAPQLGKGRLDTFQAVRAWHDNLGLK